MDEGGCTSSMKGDTSSTHLEGRFTPRRISEFRFTIEAIIRNADPLVQVCGCSNFESTFSLDRQGEGKSESFSKKN